MADVATRFRKLLEMHVIADQEKFTDDARIIDDLGADSLDVVELVMAAEEEFEIEIPDEEAEKLDTVKAFIDYIENTDHNV